MTFSIVDPHIHFWDMVPGNYPGLDNPGEGFLGDSRPICVPHLPADLRALAGDIEVLKVVHIDALAADPLRETRWLQQQADESGLPDAIVAYVDLSLPDADMQLHAHRRAAPNLRGIRQILNVHPDKTYDYVGRNFMDDPAWLAGFALLERHGLSFDLQLYPHQMPRAAELARRFPGVPIALNHAGMFADRGAPRGWREWRDGLRLLAACSNVEVKISGLGMFDHHWTLESIRPYVHECIDAFGTGRAMFASNFPVDRLFSDYATLWHAYAETVSGVSEDEQTRLFRANAERFYRI
jgi:predicted TIM-barrel fold metal-dependent hydrolase